MDLERTSIAAPVVTVGDIKQAVGALILLWSAVERELADAIGELDQDDRNGKPHGIGRSIERWKSLHDGLEIDRTEHGEVVRMVHQVLSRALRIRNGFCHGALGLTANPHGSAQAACIRIELNGRSETIGYSDLTSCIEQLGGMTSHIGRLTYAATQHDRPGMSDLYSDIRSLIEKESL